MNPIINQMMSGFMGGFMNMFNSVKNASNPNNMIQTMAQNNPQLRQVLNDISQSGTTAKDLFYARCKQQGIDPNIIISKLKNQT